MDDPSRGAVSFLPMTVPFSDLVPGTGGYDAGTGLFVAIDPVWSPYRIGGQAYDPFESMETSLDRAGAAEGYEVRGEGGRWTPGLAAALWAAMEGDLYRFAFDMSFIRDLEAQRDSGEWKRFARLNDMYRACIRAMVPYGTAPAFWTDWLRGAERNAGKGISFCGTLERVLTRPVDSLVRAIARHAPTGSIFSLRSRDRVES